mmetsp:Transcript_944/g.2053  ORF Transcript_944/g.2053 Transcript_944/m.2053 type:complete len:211 (-) Transcript_944:181-813(-)
MHRKQGVIPECAQPVLGGQPLEGPEPLVNPVMQVRQALQHVLQVIQVVLQVLGPRQSMQIGHPPFIVYYFDAADADAHLKHLAAGHGHTVEVHHLVLLLLQQHHHHNERNKVDQEQHRHAGQGVVAEAPHDAQRLHAAQQLDQLAEALPPLVVGVPTGGLLPDHAALVPLVSIPLLARFIRVKPPRSKTMLRQGANAPPLHKAASPVVIC